jgi:hypothetical protein
MASVLLQTTIWSTAKDEVFVSHCRRRRKESLICWPSAQTRACSKRAD